MILQVEIWEGDWELPNVLKVNLLKGIVHSIEPSMSPCSEKVPEETNATVTKALSPIQNQTPTKKIDIEEGTVAEEWLFNYDS